MNLLKTSLCALALLCAAGTAFAASPSSASFRIDASQRGKIIGNKVSTINIWQFQNWKPGKDEGADLTKFVESIQFMQATGGNETRDLFVDPKNTDVVDDYDFAPLLRACHDVLNLNAKPLIKLSVPDKFSKETVIDGFSVDALPPDDYDVYYNYIHAMAEELVKEFGLEEVLSWGWGVLVEFENASWFHDKAKTPEGSRDAFFKLYDYSAAALTDVLGDDIYIGAHAMACTEGLWDERDFLDHCAKDKNAKTGEPIPIKYFACSFYDDKPDKPHGLTLAQTVERIRERAESLGLNDLRYGIDEGRILDGSMGVDDDDLIHRIVGQTYQASYDARTFKILVDNDIDYFSAWSYSSAGPYSGYPLIAYRVAEQLVNFKNAKLLGMTSEKALAEGVDCDAVAGFDEETDTLYLVAYNFKFDLDYDETADLAFMIDAPFWKDQTLEFSVMTISDADNFFCKWLEDREKYQISNDAFHWSPDSGCLDGALVDPKVRELYYSKLRPGYVEIANRAPETTTTDMPAGKDGKIEFCGTLPRHGVMFCTIRAK